jgi:hypothetical protein
MLERDLSGAELFQELSGLVGCHGPQVAMGRPRWSRAKPGVPGLPTQG